MRITITESNRDGAKLWLAPLHDNIYTLESNKSYVLEYLRFGNDINGIIYIDPSGGPFISRGDTFDGKTITKIYFNNSKINIELV